MSGKSHSRRRTSGKTTSTGIAIVTDDLIGLSGFYPKFVKKYINLEEILDKTFNKFKKEVRRNKFPNKKNNY